MLNGDQFYKTAKEELRLKFFLKKLSDKFPLIPFHKIPKKILRSKFKSNSKSTR